MQIVETMVLDDHGLVEEYTEGSKSEHVSEN
jgi:hypothetical protein